MLQWGVAVSPSANNSDDVWVLGRNRRHAATGHVLAIALKKHLLFCQDLSPSYGGLCPTKYKC